MKTGMKIYHSAPKSSTVRWWFKSFPYLQMSKWIENALRKGHAEEKNYIQPTSTLWRETNLKELKFCPAHLKVVQLFT